MNIIIVMRSWSYRGGERIMLNLAKSLAGRGHKVHVIAARKEKGFHKKDTGYTISYPVKLNTVLQNNFLALVLGTLYIAIEIRKRIKNTDLILTESDACLNGSFLANIGTGKKMIWYVFDYNDQRFQNRAVQFIWNLSEGSFESLAVKQVDKIIALSVSVKRIIEKKFSRSVDVLYPIVDFSRGEVKNIDKPEEKIIKIYKNRKVMFLPAALYPQKNQKLAINLLSARKNEVSDLVLVLAGEGKDKEKLKKLARERGVGTRVFFPGILKGEILRYAYKNAFVTLICSNTTNEGLSLTALESLNLNTPVIVSSVAGVSGFLKENGVGIVKSPNIDSFAKGFDELSGNYGKYKKQMGKIKKLIKDNFSERVIYDNFLNIVSYRQ